MYTSTQVGKECQFTTGLAVVITTTYNETRIQPNTKCPKKSYQESGVMKKVFLCAILASLSYPAIASSLQDQLSAVAEAEQQGKMKSKGMRGIARINGKCNFDRLWMLIINTTAQSK